MIIEIVNKKQNADGSLELEILYSKKLIRFIKRKLLRKNLFRKVAIRFLEKRISEIFKKYPDYSKIEKFIKIK